jgi:uncharacterized tellurite resistance protein B-like protein
MFTDASAEERRQLLRLVSTVIESDEQIDLAENDYLREVASLLGLPESELDGLVVDIEMEEIQEDFDEVSRKAPPPIPRIGGD